MSAAAAPRLHSDGETFRHEALLYAGEEGFVEGTAPFVRDGVDAGEHVLVVVSERKIGLLREALGDAAGSVRFADMGEVGRNPARIIPAWHDFVAAAPPGARLRGIGEPVSPHLTPTKLVECQHHESLLNLAFASAPPFWLLCPYDVDALDPAVVDEACRSHPFLLEGRASRASGDYRGIGAAAAPFDAPLPEPSVRPAELRFEAGPLDAVRRFVAEQAGAAGLGEERLADLVLAVHEVAVNSLLHGSGSGIVRLWQDGRDVICELRDGGRFDEPLAGRIPPGRDAEGGRGLWMANQLCDLVQIRSYPTGTVVRLHLGRS